jgi:sulfofructose kinase
MKQHWKGWLDKTRLHSPDVVGLGYCTYDILTIVPGLPDFDDVRMTHVADLVHDGGGQVGTALTALARLGMQTGYLGALGDDREGRWLRRRFEQEGVDLSRLRVRGDIGTNICLLLVEQGTARRAILCHPRVGVEALVLDQVDRAYIRRARVLHLDGQFMPAAIEAALWARESGVKVCFDGNHPRRGLDELLPLVDWLVVAETFPAAYTGLSDPERAAHALLDTGAEVVVVTRGEKGCQVWTPETRFSVAAIKVQAVDTTGAGDAFHGGFIYAMLQGWDLEEAATFANGVAAINCQTLGGRRGLPTLDQVQRVLPS